MAARTTKTTLNNDWKKRIQASQIMNRLAKCANGEIEMSSNSIKAADIVLKKTIPDLSRIDSTNLNVNTEKLTKEQRDAIYATIKG